MESVMQVTKDERGKLSATRVAGLSLVFTYIALAFLDAAGRRGTLDMHEGLVTLILGLFGFAGARSGVMNWRHSSGEGTMNVDQGKPGRSANGDGSFHTETRARTEP